MYLLRVSGVLTLLFEGDRFRLYCINKPK